jgi:hypothetical protein
MARLKAKVMSIARFNRMLKNVKENAEIIAKAKIASPDGMLPKGLLTKGMQEIRADVE